MADRRDSALVLAGGGVAGIAWELGVLQGIADAAPAVAADLLAADLVVGTSAGAAVAAQVTSGTPLEELYERQLAGTAAEIAADLDLERWVATLAEVVGDAPSPRVARQRIGALALAAATPDEAARRAAVASRLPVDRWPDRDLRVTVVAASTGDLVVLDRTSGADLVDAVTASCAVPGVWPPATIGGRRYVDGGVRSTTNADLAAGCRRVAVVVPSLPGAPLLSGDLEAELAALAPAHVDLVHADEASLAAFGTNPLDRATRPASAAAGRAVGRAAVDRLARTWGPRAGA